MQLLKVLLLTCFLSIYSYAQDINAVAQGASTAKWANESEAGLSSSKSAQSAALDSTLYYGKHKSTVEMGVNTYSAFGNYFYGKQGDQLNTRNWMAGFKWDRAFNDRLKGFLAETLEGNRFMGYVLKIKYRS
jgi:hypothetical protein